MSRRPPSDAFTRFTSTAPYASKKPPSSTTQSSFSYQPPTQSSPSPSPSISANSHGNGGETPAQKVARLRAASRAAKSGATLSPLDRVIERGRIWADRAHRVTTYTLIGLTGISTVVAVYGLTSLVAHNRRQKRAWIEREMDRLRAAQQAFLRGEASAEQLHLLEQERAGEEMQGQREKEARRRKEAGVWARVKGLVGGGASAGEMGREELPETEARDLSRIAPQRLFDEAWVQGEVTPTVAPVAESGIKGVGVDEKGRPVPAGKMQRVVRDVHDERRTGEREVTKRTGITGGPLDVLAGNVAQAVVPVQSGEGGGWTSWLRGSKS